MSGIAALALASDQVVDPDLLQRLMQSLARSGPDAQNSWSGGAFGLAHSLLRTTDEVDSKQQPFSLDGDVWIAADARIDARAVLVNELRGQGERDASLECTDAELVLRAYRAWGRNCLDRLLGDFTFAIVDQRNESVFCARDHLGVRPLFFASGDDWFFSSNDLDSVRLLPQVRDDLNDSWVADFLLFGWNTDASSTVFADIYRLLPGHYLQWSQGAMDIRQYWRLEIPEEAEPMGEQTRIEQFLETFRVAVSDRIRSARVAVSMSGGLDSAAVAAMAVRTFPCREGPSAVKAFTNVFDSLVPDNERYYAGRVAQHLCIPIRFFPLDDTYGYDHHWDRPETQYPEPTHRLWKADDRSRRQEIAEWSRTVLWGEGGDELVSWCSGHFRGLLLGRDLRRWVRDCYQYLRVFREVPPHGIRTSLRGLLSDSPVLPKFPSWINSDLVDRLGLVERWEEFHAPPIPVGSRTPDSHRLLTGFQVPNCLNDRCADGVEQQVVNLFPLMDIRLIKMVWAYPVMPYWRTKWLLREAMSGYLPKDVVTRPKEGLHQDPHVACGQWPPVTWETCVDRTPDLTSYVSTSPKGGSSQRDSHSIRLDSRPFELASWLEHRARTKRTA